jgi:hypothetical protein
VDSPTDYRALPIDHNMCDARVIVVIMDAYSTPCVGAKRGSDATSACHGVLWRTNSWTISAEFGL